MRCNRLIIAKKDLGKTLEDLPNYKKMGSGMDSRNFPKHLHRWSFSRTDQTDI